MKLSDGAQGIIAVLLVMFLIGVMLYHGSEANQEDRAQQCRVAQDQKANYGYCESVEMQKRVARQRKEIREISK